MLTINNMFNVYEIIFSKVQYTATRILQYSLQPLLMINSVLFYVYLLYSMQYELLIYIYILIIFIQMYDTNVFYAYYNMDISIGNLLNKVYQ